MKWIGQHIYDLISRFRSDVYLEDVSTGTIASGGNLGLDSNNKIVKATETTGDITSIVAGTGLSGTSLTGPIPTLNVDASQLQITRVGTINAGVWQGTAINATYLDGQSGTNTGDETLASINALDITEVGTIDSGVWQGTAIASAYLDADTAHLSTSKQCTYYMMVDDIDTTKIYIPLQTPDTETSVATNKQLRFLAPFAGKLLKVFLRANTNLSSNTLTWTLETRNTSSSTSGTPTVVGTQSGAGCTNKTMTTYDFTSSLDSGDNIIDAGDTVQLAVQSDSATANSQFYITCLWEWNLG